MPERVDFYTNEEYEQACMMALEEERERIALEEYRQECAFKEYLNRGNEDEVR